MEKEKRSGVYVDMAEELLKKLKIQAIKEDKSLKDLVNELVQRYIDKSGD